MLGGVFVEWSFCDLARCPLTGRYRGAGSSGRCNTSIKSFGWGCKSQSLRGRSLSCRATLLSWACEYTDRSVPFGKYCRSRPLVFSLEPRCHGLCRSQKITGLGRRLQSLGLPINRPGLHLRKFWLAALCGRLISQFRSSIGKAFRDPFRGGLNNPLSRVRQTHE